MALPLARTNAEAHLYMELHPCACGEVRFDRQSAVVTIGDDLASRYAGACTRCGQQREFLFRLPERILVPEPGQVRFGDGRPSELIDPGEWLALADAYASTGPADTGQLDPGAARRVRADLATAIAALDEVLKFVPPGADAVPAEAFWSERGRAVRATEPGRFRAARLHAVRDAYADLLPA
jgi:hypothetical protein